VAGGEGDDDGGNSGGWVWPEMVAGERV